MRTLKDLIEDLSNTQQPGHGIFLHIDPVELRKLAKEWIKYLNKQEKLHLEWVSNSVGENPSCERPRGFNFEHSLPNGYEEIRIWIKKFFNLEDE